MFFKDTQDSSRVLYFSLQYVTPFRNSLNSGASSRESSAGRRDDSSRCRIISGCTCAGHRAGPWHYQPSIGAGWGCNNCLLQPYLRRGHTMQAGAHRGGYKYHTLNQFSLLNGERSPIVLFRFLAGSAIATCKGEQMSHPFSQPFVIAPSYSKRGQTLNTQWKSVRQQVTPTPHQCPQPRYQLANSRFPTWQSRSAPPQRLTLVTQRCNQCPY
ncbi:hypothetical protein NIES2134_117360 [Thermostichus vulcanus NIES-2134]|nr:hypothetical protein NIES2134_117360 [Thermostichus vulcanus NIES-2134]